MAKPRKQHPHLLVLRGLRRGNADLARQGIEEELERTSQPILAYLREQCGTSVAKTAGTGARDRQVPETT